MKKQTSRRDFLAKLACSTVGAMFSGCRGMGGHNGSEKTNVLPNIVLIMIDDLGWMDLHCQGNPRLDTPHIDKLAVQGMRFPDAYAAAPVCSPTRASIMTGLSPARLGLTTHIPDGPRFWPDDAVLQSAETLDYLPLSYDTVAEHLHAAGYATAFMGKWHLAGKSTREDKGRGDEKYHPGHQGYDRNIGGCALGGPPTYFDPYKICNIPPRREGEYLPDRLVDESIAFIREHRNDPFFLTLWNYTVHWPMEAPEALIEKYKKREGPGVKDPRYAAMIEAMDAAMGRLFKELDQLGLASDTLVIFTSDNGGYMGAADNRPLRKGKGYLYEGGIRVPLIIRWPGRIAPGTTCRTPVISMDFFPTILEAAGLVPDKNITLDGESLLPLVKQQGQLKRDAIFFHYPNYAWHRSNRLGGVVREGKYKLINWYADDSVELYNLSEDIGEEHDLSGTLPGKAEKLHKKLRAWLEEVDARMPEPKS